VPALGFDLQLARRQKPVLLTRTCFAALPDAVRPFPAGTDPTPGLFPPMKAPALSRLFALAAASVLVLFLTSACTITPEPANISLIPIPKLGTPSNQQTPIYIAKVTDERVFKLNSATPSDPSLVTVQQLTAAKTDSAVAQIRSADATVFRDLFLKDKTVADTVKEALEESFRRAGFPVVKAPAEAKDARAIPVDVKINRFWAYNTGSWTFLFTFDIEVTVTADTAVLSAGKKISQTVSLKSAVAAGPGSFENTINKGMEMFVNKAVVELH
jgi:hypothetical protein